MSLNPDSQEKPLGNPLDNRGQGGRADTLAFFLREWIVTGQFSPGDRLPSRASIEKRFETTPVTVQRVFDRLQKDGFVEARGRAGTFVSDHPPHLCNYGLVFPRQEADGRSWPNFWHVLKEQAITLTKGAPGQRLRIIFAARRHSDLAAYQQAIDDVVNHRFAGLLFPANPFEHEGSPLLEEPDIPRISVDSGQPTPELGRVHLKGLHGRAMECLKARGVTRIAIMMSSWEEPGPLVKLACRYGLSTQPKWVQGVLHGEPDELVANCVAMLLSGAPEDRPDGLLICDDNVVPAATKGILAAGLGGGSDLTVAAHANFPAPTVSHVPAIRVGYDVRKLVVQSFQWIDRCRDEGVSLEPVRLEAEVDLGADPTA